MISFSFQIQKEQMSLTGIPLQSSKQSGEYSRRKSRVLRLAAETLCFHFGNRPNPLKNAKDRDVNWDVKQNAHGNWWRQPSIFDIIYGVVNAKRLRTMDMISLHDIQKSYGSHQVLKNVDLAVRQGEIYGLIGKKARVKPQFSRLFSG